MFENVVNDARAFLFTTRAKRKRRFHYAVDLTEKKFRVIFALRGMTTITRIVTRNPDAVDKAKSRR